MAEVSRLERCKTEAMRELTLAKARDLLELCAATHVQAPDTASLLEEMDRRGADGASNPGQVRGGGNRAGGGPPS